MTRNPDLRPREFNANPILEVPESHVISDSRGRQVIAYVMDNPHAKGMMMAWVPDAMRFASALAATAPGPVDAGPEAQSADQPAEGEDAPREPSGIEEAA